jgi:site-specific recombinase XerD
LACARAVTQFFDWCDQHQIGGLIDIEPIHVAAYIEGLQQSMSKPTAKQHLAAIPMLFDWLVTGQVVVMNPANSVRGPPCLPLSMKDWCRVSRDRLRRAGKCCRCQVIPGSLTIP